MRTQERLALAVGLALVFSLWGHSTLAGQPDEDRSTRVADLRTKIRAASPDARGPARDQLADAIHELGRLRAVEAAPELSELLEFEDLRAWRGAGEVPGYRERYPAIGALVEIGGTSVPAVLEAVAAARRSERFVKNAAVALLEATGDDPQAVRATVARRGAGESGGRKSRLDELSQLLLNAGAGTSAEGDRAIEPEEP